MKIDTNFSKGRKSGGEKEKLLDFFFPDNEKF